MSEQNNDLGFQLYHDCPYSFYTSLKEYLESRIKESYESCRNHVVRSDPWGDGYTAGRENGTLVTYGTVYRKLFGDQYYNSFLKTMHLKGA